MTDIEIFDLLQLLRQGIAISRERNIQLDYANVAEKAVNVICDLQNRLHDANQSIRNLEKLIYT